MGDAFAWLGERLAPLVTGPQAVWSLLWVLLLLVTVGLLVMMHTRWGQSRAMEKCVVLSLLAHVLLGGWATTVQLVSSVTSPEDDEVWIGTVSDIDEHSVAGEQTGDAALPESPAKPTQPWDATASSDLPAPAPSELARPDGDKVQSPVRLASATDKPSSDVPLPARATPRVASSDDPALRDDSQPQRSAKSASGDIDVAAPTSRQPAATQIDDPTAPRRVAASAGDETRTGSQSDNSSLANVIASLPRVDGPTRAGSQGGDDLTGTDDLRNRLTEKADAKATGNGRKVPAVYELRVVPDRVQQAKQRGATSQTEAAVQAALKWLAANQSADGRWDADQFGAGREDRVLGHDREGAGARADTAVTGLALLAYLGSGNTHLKGSHRDTVRRGLEFLIAVQGRDGNLAGDAETFAKMYCHGMASFALSEAYAMTGDERLRPYVERAIDYCVRAQHPSSGGWRYVPGDLGDTSQLGWQVMALKSAELAGIPIPTKTRAGAAKFLTSVSSGEFGGYAAYRPGQRATRVMTAEAMVCRNFLGTMSDKRTAQEAADYIVGELPSADGKPNLYYWYYATLSMYQLQGDSWRRWNEALRPTLVKLQRTDGKMAGSWDTDTVWGGYGGRVYTTAMAALCLEVYYRFLPLYGDGEEGISGEKAEEESQSASSRLKPIR